MSIKAFCILGLVLTVAACGGQQAEQTAVNHSDGEQFYFADKYEFANRQQAVYFERAARFRVLQQGIYGDFERFLKGEMPKPEQIAKYRENITQAVGYYEGQQSADDPFQSCGKAAKDAGMLVKIMVTVGDSGIAESDRQSGQDYRLSMQQCRHDLSTAENSLTKK